MAVSGGDAKRGDFFIEKSIETKLDVSPSAADFFVKEFFKSMVAAEASLLSVLPLPSDEVLCLTFFANMLGFRILFEAALSLLSQLP